MSETSWSQRLFGGFAKTSERLTANLAGVGGSAKLDDATLDEVTTPRVIEALGLGPVAVAGHSMGSLIAAGLAIERPDLVARAALLNGVHRRSPEARAAVLNRAADIAADRSRASYRAAAPRAACCPRFTGS